MSEDGQNVPAGSLDSEPFATMPGRNGKSSTGALPFSPLYLKFATGPLNIPDIKLSTDWLLLPSPNHLPSWWLRVSSAKTFPSRK